MTADQLAELVETVRGGFCAGPHGSRGESAFEEVLEELDLAERLLADVYAGSSVSCVAPGWSDEDESAFFAIIERAEARRR